MQSMAKQSMRALPQMGKQGVCVCVRPRVIPTKFFIFVIFSINSELPVHKQRLARHSCWWWSRDYGTSEDKNRKIHGLPKEIACQDAAG